MIRKCLFIIFLLLAEFSFAQNRGNIWCFGDSAGIDFSNLQNPQPISSTMDGRGSCVSISDSTGNLLFYSSTSDPFLLAYDELVYVRNASNQVMVNGDSIVGLNWYQELVITDNPINMNTYYLFSVGVVTSYGLYYSSIDMNMNGGMGEVVQKNVQLTNFKCTDGITAIKHGNGRDWWLIVRRWGTPNNEFHKFLITPNGISTDIIQNIGSSTVTTPFFRQNINRIYFS